jgi:hypothetical protein
VVAAIGDKHSWGENTKVEAVTSYVLKKIADVALTKIAETLRKSKITLHTTKDDVESALDHHLREVKNWSSEISFSDLQRPKATAEVFVPLNVFLHPRRRHVSSAEAADAVSLEDLLNETLKPVPASLYSSANPPPAKAPHHSGTAGSRKNHFDEAPMSQGPSRKGNFSATKSTFPCWYGFGT